MSRNLYLTFLTLCALWVFSTSAFAEEIADIEIRGNKAVDLDNILLQISSEKGRPFQSAKARADIKEIYRMGFFKQVVVKWDSQRQVLIFDIEEKPAIRSVYIEGNKNVSDDVLKEKLNIENRRFFDAQKIRVGIEEAKQYYQSQGFYGTEISFSVEEVGKQQIDLTLEVEEGQKKVIRKIVFEGNEHFSDSDLEDVVQTSTYNWWVSWLTGSGILKAEVLENDVRILTGYYLSNGHAEVRVGEPLVEDVEEGLRVTFRLEEGDMFYFGETGAEGTLLDGSEEKTLEGISVVSGEQFDIEKLRADSFSISEKFTDIGYAFANVEPKTDIDRVNKKVHVAYQVDKGSLITVDRIELSGNNKTRDNVIRRTLKIQEQDLFSSSKIRRSQQLLERLGYFEEVTITPNKGEREEEVDLLVSVREGTTGSFSAGAGLSSGDGFVVSTQIREVNLFGTGNSLTLNVNTGSRRENFVLSFSNPRVNDTYWSLGLDVLSVEREFDDFDRNQSGGSVSFGYPLWFLGPEYLEDVRFSIQYEYLKIKIDEVNSNAPALILSEEGKSTSSSITPRIVRNTVNNPIDPTGGSRQTLGVELAGLGGEEEFWLLQTSNTFYTPLFETGLGPVVFSNRIRFGYGKTFNNQDFPLFRRFFPGGINSVRGFKARELGPKDEQGNEFGGSKQLVTNFELIFPLLPEAGVKGLVFFDAGNAFEDSQDIELNTLRLAVGWGIRWRSPIAPLRIEIGYPLDREEGDDSAVVNFSFGAPL